jgi:hypothetical protein
VNVPARLSESSRWPGAALGHEATIIGESKLVGPSTTGASHGTRSLHDDRSPTLARGTAKRSIRSDPKCAGRLLPG